MGKKKTKGDVAWYMPLTARRPLCYSTVADSDAISLINSPNMTARELMGVMLSGKYLVSSDMLRIVQTFIDNGYGDEIIKTRQI